MKTRFIQFLWAVCLIAVPTNSVRSQSSIYSDFGSFYNASSALPGNHQTISFAGLPSDEIGPVLTISDVTFRGAYLLRKSGSSITTIGPVLYNFDSSIPLTIHFATGAHAFGGNFSSLLSPYYSSFTATLSLDNGETLRFTAPTNPNSTFFGFISPIPIRDMTFSDGGLFGLGHLHEELIGNIYMVTEVPEPGICALLGFGAALLLSWRLRRKP